MVGVPVLYNRPRLKAQGPCRSGFLTPRSPVNMRGRSQIGAGMETDRIAAKQLLEPEKLLKPDEVLGYIESCGITHGLYGWWFDESLPTVPRGGCIKRNGKHLLYVGIAPRKGRTAKTCARSPLKQRFQQNHLRRVRKSTLRKSLSALLNSELRLEFTRDKDGKLGMGRRHEAALSEWINQHAAVSMVQHLEPWRVEEELVRHGPPLPLNIQMSAHPFSSILSEMRCALG